jgi:DNA-directed RNA polymerase subunit RPC12/RpoP
MKITTGQLRQIIREEIKKLQNNLMVACRNCGWKWKFSDGGNDPYICHQCGGHGVIIK